mmetsp:Transcript_140897/g.392740  ORF Transcript_140897/g.392740 Transcript_140897/m.392740 type:complete len:148 (-) Transcript_140897:85-528(-)
MLKAGNGHLCEVRLPSDAVPGQTCMADVWGYAVQPADVFSSGVCLFILAWQCPPWRLATLADPMFAFVHGRGAGGLEALLSYWKRPLLPAGAMQLLAELLHPDPAQRPSPAACLASPWLLPAADSALQQDMIGTVAVEAGTLAAASG